MRKRGFGLVKHTGRTCVEPKCNAPLLQRAGESDEEFARRYLCLGCQEYRAKRGAHREYERERQTLKNHPSTPEVIAK